MQTDFFSALQTLNITGRLMLVIDNTVTDRWAVTVHLQSPDLQDEALQLIPPRTVAGSVADLNADFFTTILKPLQRLSGLYSDTAAYEAQLEQVAAQTRKAKDAAKAAGSTTVGTTGQGVSQKVKNRFEEAMKKVALLAAKELFGQAIAALPKLAEYPSFEKQITERKLALEKEMAAKRGGDLFASMGEPATGEEETGKGEDGNEQKADPLIEQTGNLQTDSETENEDDDDDDDDEEQEEEEQQDPHSFIKH